MTHRIRIGTRQSPLALWQANYIADALTRYGYQVELVKITTTGDVTTTPLGQSGGVGLFTKEIQRALLDGRCDVAVHSLKDLPTEPIEGLTLAAVPPREDPSDCLIASSSAKLNDLPSGSRIGTGSPRRRAQLLHLRPDLNILDIRGNVETRLAKLAQGSYDAIILAFAGLHRLNFEDNITEKLSHEQMLPAVGQAALGLETRSQDPIAIEAVRNLNDPVTLACVRAERGLLRALRAGCLAPVAAHATEREGQLRMRAQVYSADGVTMIASDVSTPIDLTTIFESTTPESLAALAMNELSDQGAEELIAATRKPTPSLDSNS